LAKADSAYSLSLSGAMLRLVGDLFQYNTGAGWVDIVDSLDDSSYPQSMVLSIPDQGDSTRTFMFVDLHNGLCCYDGINFWQQSIPKRSGVGNIAGGQWLAQADGRAFVAGDWIETGEPGIIHYCKAGDPGDHTTPTDTSRWVAPFGGSIPVYMATSRGFKAGTTRCTGLLELQNKIWAFTESGRFRISGAGTSNEYIDYVPGYGCISGKTIVEVDGNFYWWDKTGCYEWAGSGNPRTISNQIFPLMHYLKFTDGNGLIAQNFYSFVWLKYYITAVRLEGLAGIPYTGAYATGLNAWLVFDLITRTWHIWNIPSTCAAVLSAGTDFNSLYFASPIVKDAQYRTYRFAVDDQTGGTVNDDDGENIMSIWLSPKMGSPSYKHWLNARIRGSLEGGSTPVTANAQVYRDDDMEMPGSITLTNGSKLVLATGLNLSNNVQVGDLICLQDNPGIDSPAEVASLTEWWSVAYTGGSGTAPIVGELLTGGTSGKKAYLAVVTAPTTGSWAGNDAAGTIYVYGKSGTFVAEQVNGTACHFHIATDFVSVEHLELVSNYTGPTGTGAWSRLARFTWPTDPRTQPYHKLVLDDQYSNLIQFHWYITSMRKFALKWLEFNYEELDRDAEEPA
jgi:hypothetical protein